MPTLTTEQIKLLMHQRLLVFSVGSLNVGYEAYPTSIGVNSRGYEFFRCFYRSVNRPDTEFQSYAFNPSSWDFYLPGALEQANGDNWREVERPQSARYIRPFWDSIISQWAQSFTARMSDSA